MCHHARLKNYELSNEKNFELRSEPIPILFLDEWNGRSVDECLGKLEKKVNGDWSKESSW